jgi:uncharacterized protein with GYD domain
MTSYLVTGTYEKDGMDTAGLLARVEEINAQAGKFGVTITKTWVALGSTAEIVGILDADSDVDIQKMVLWSKRELGQRTHVTRLFDPEETAELLGA